MLFIHLKRFEYDPIHNTMVKLNDRFEFPIDLDLTEFMHDPAQEEHFVLYRYASRRNQIPELIHCSAFLYIPVLSLAAITTLTFVLMLAHPTANGSNSMMTLSVLCRPRQRPLTIMGATVP